GRPADGATAAGPGAGASAAATGGTGDGPAVRPASGDDRSGEPRQPPLDLTDGPALSPRPGADRRRAAPRPSRRPRRRAVVRPGAGGARNRGDAAGRRRAGAALKGRKLPRHRLAPALAPDRAGPGAAGGGADAGLSQLLRLEPGHAFPGRAT